MRRGSAADVSPVHGSYDGGYGVGSSGWVVAYDGVVTDVA
jgi:hypothetical protein